jgi:hypothetical protein
MELCTNDEPVVVDHTTLPKTNAIPPPDFRCGDGPASILKYINDLIVATKHMLVLSTKQ